MAATTPNPNAPHIVLNVQPGAPSFTLNVGEGGCWVSFGDQPEVEEPEEDPFTGCEALGGITALQASAPTAWERDRAALARAKAEKKALEMAVRSGFIVPDGELHQAMLNDICDRLRDACDYDNETREDLARIRFGEDTAEAGTTITAPISLRGKAKLSFWMVNEAGERLGKKIRHTIELGGDDEADKAEDTGPEYDTIDQSKIQPGDYVEYHNGDSVSRWLVLERNKTVCPTRIVNYVKVMLLDSPINGTDTVELPLPGDPFILRPRS